MKLTKENKMPYIPKERRSDLVTIGGYAETCGELNYYITNEILCYLYRGQHRTGEFKNTSYSDYNEVMGVLECVKQEIYRRLIVPYEDDRREEHGDVF